MSPGSSTESYPAFARIGLRKNPGKNLNQVTCPDRDSNPDHLVSRPDVLTITPQISFINQTAASIRAMSSSSGSIGGSSSVRTQKSQVGSRSPAAVPLPISSRHAAFMLTGRSDMQEASACIMQPHPLFVAGAFLIASPAKKELYLRLRWAGHVARMREFRNAYKVLVGRPDGKRPLGKARRRWEDTIKMDLREVGYDERDWINLAQDRDRWRAYVRAEMKLRVP
ncbi:hypothetical protein ANN_18633 [Periplaneta americana]|uniref:Uncharacterized protein n=1 Tax=Periplaneta americana TaxID=6978 RepID=A0ABQ8SQC3_PERAM|nr:hypothetical protein ANN_18633 [Periplaneta americana]